MIRTFPAKVTAPDGTSWDRALAIHGDGRLRVWVVRDNEPALVVDETVTVTRDGASWSGDGWSVARGRGCGCGSPLKGFRPDIPAVTGT